LEGEEQKMSANNFLKFHLVLFHKPFWEWTSN